MLKCCYMILKELLCQWCDCVSKATIVTVHTCASHLLPVSSDRLALLQRWC